MNDTQQSIARHRLDLAKELLDDIELSRLPPEQLLLKASRLARLVEANEVREWLHFELVGYPNTEQGRRHMDLMGRLTDEARNLGYWIPFAAINGTITSFQVQIQQLRVPDVQLSVSSANPHEFVTGFAGTNVTGLSAPAQAVLGRLRELTTGVSTLNGIRSRVLARVHAFVVDTYHKLAFSGAAESIFQQHQTSVDALLREAAPDVLEKVPSISERLAAGDLEAISQAMNSCRRMIRVFADSVYPPSDTPVTVDGQDYQVGSDRVLNRIGLFLRGRCASDTRRDRLNQVLRRIHERASAGSHADVTAGEARALFLQTYLVLGEIVEATQQTLASTEAGAKAEALNA